jgi:hypothetical protein
MDKTLRIDGCDEAIVGVGCRCGQPLVVVYDRDKLIQHFHKEGMTLEEAEEWVSYNIEGAWLGEGTPVIMEAASPKEILDRIEEETM